MALYGYMGKVGKVGKVERVADACLYHDSFVHELHKGTRIVYLHEFAKAGLLAIGFSCWLIWTLNCSTEVVGQDFDLSRDGVNGLTCEWRLH